MTGLERCYHNAVVSREQNIAADHVHSFMSEVIPDGRALFQLERGPVALQKLIEDLWDVLDN